MGLALGTLITEAARQAFEQQSGSRVTTSDTAKNCVRHLTRMFQSQVKEGSLTDRARLQREATQYIFKAFNVEECSEGAKNLQALLDKEFTEQFEAWDARDLDLRLPEVQDRIKTPLAKQLADILASKDISYGSSDGNVVDQRRFVQEAMAQAIKDATNEDGKFKMADVCQNFKTIIKANANELDGKIVGGMIESLNELAIRSSVFVVMPEIEGLAELKFETEGMSEKLDIKGKDAVREAVNKLLEAKLEAEKNETQFDLQTEIAKQNLNADQLAYFNELIIAYKEAGGKDGLNDLTKMLQKSLPDLAMTGFIGAAVGWLFGGNLALGAIAGAILSFFGKMDEGFAEEPDTRLAPPEFKLVSRQESVNVPASAA